MKSVCFSIVRGKFTANRESNGIVAREKSLRARSVVRGDSWCRMDGTSWEERSV